MVNNFLFRLSILLVAILSVTRSIAILMPHKAKRFRISAISMLVASYITVILIIDWTALSLGWIRSAHYPPFSYCTIFLASATPSWAKRLYEVTIQLEMILPTVVVFLSFAVSASALLWKARAKAETEKKLQQASVTISCFTALFLLCNIPIFVYQMAWFLASIPSLRTTIDFSILHGNYGGLMLQYFPYILNAGLNPCLYLLRMRRYQRQFICWFQSFLRKIGYSPSYDVSV